MRYILATVLFVFTLQACELPEKSSTEKGQEEQEKLMERARQSQPTPQVNNFLTRKNIAKWMERMDTPDKLFYIYVLADNGAKIGYFVAQYRPVSTATFLTPPKREYEMHYGGHQLGPAPALDGTYYGSGGASQQYFFFDAETDAFIELQGLNYILMDQPLAGIDVPRLKVEVEN